jgi:hypothetical protein
VLTTCCGDRYALGKWGYDDDQVYDLASKIERVIDDQLIHDERQGGGGSLIELLRSVGKQVSEEAKSTDNQCVHGLLDKLHSAIEGFNCSKCGPRKFVCNGVVDEELFGPENGGRCLGFLREMVKLYAEFALTYYERELGQLLPDRLPSIVIETHPARHESTLPLDGELIPARLDGSEDDFVTMRFRWPVTNELQDALLSLAYLVFHEVFVHYFQGLSANTPGFSVDNDCSFTEGAIDALACQVLLDELLRSDKHLPELLKPLQEAFKSYSQRYHEERFDFKPPKSAADYRDPLMPILRARFYGREKIYRWLRKLESDSKQPENWAYTILLALNLQLAPAQRERFYCSVDRLPHRGVAGLAVAKLALEEYRNTLDYKELLDTMESIVSNDSNGS